MLQRLDAIISSFETEDGVYQLFEMIPEMYKENMRETRRKAAAAGRVGMVRKSTFINHCKQIGTIKL